ncbi:ferritin light chain-like isoform X3 [Dasypus novemcinctus]|uniref:ferritin light chain-like isoform X3 n=1 Tax=Dasypus novemcinctus TaxID=9361 RepID=UPI00265DDD2B|nr:ferritin light chain-like [Dasypus novemcinctus]
MASQICQNDSAQAETSVNCLINLQLQASYAYLALGYYFDHNKAALKGVDLFFCELVKEKLEGPEQLLKMQNPCAAAVPSSRTCRSLPEVSGVVAMEAALVLEKTLNQALWDLHALGSANPDPHLRDFLENRFLEEEVQLMEVYGKSVPNVCYGP